MDPRPHPTLDVPAESTDLLEQTRDRLWEEMLTIDTQLGDPYRVDPRTGQPFTDDQYESWRRGAIRAKNAKLKLYRLIKSELRKRNKAANVKATTALTRTASSLSSDGDAADSQGTAKGTDEA